jgi:hypothetical protein
MAEPVLVALLFADRVIVEEKNKKKTVVGTFTRFYSDKFPVSFPPWYIYAAATNISGEHSFSLNLVLEKDMQVVVPINGKLKVDNPRNVIELIFPIGQAIFPTPGEYTLTFNIDGIQVGSRILEVLSPEQGTIGERIQ